MVDRSDAELISYVTDNCDRAALRLRGPSDAAAAVVAMEQAAAAVLTIRHPDEPTMSLPNWCAVSVEDGEPVLQLDMKDNRDYAGQVVSIILASLDAAGVDGRLEPKRSPEPPFEYDAAADIVTGGDYLWELDERGLPPSFPAGFPIPDDATCVMAQRADDGTWEHAAWRRARPFEEYLDRLRLFGCSLEAAQPADPVIGLAELVHHRIHHVAGTGSVSLRHKTRRKAPAKQWYVSVVWTPTAR
jgi:hypothetical protein